MDVKKKLALAIRVISVPPVMAALLVVALWFGEDGVFASIEEALATVFFLSLLPLLAYPISAMVPALRQKEREGQRNLAFALSVAGYVGAWLYGALGHRGAVLLFIYGTYLFSVAILLIFNKLLHLRASGHACSVAGPILLVIYFLGGWWVPALMALYAAIFWASVAAKRHTVGEFLLGTVSVVCAMLLSWLIYM